MAKKRLPMNFEFGNQGLPGTQKTTFDEIFKGKRRSTLRSYDHGLNVGDIVEVISANPRRIGEVKITGIRDVDASMAEEISKTERWTPDYIRKRLSGSKKTQQIFYEPIVPSSPAKITDKQGNVIVDVTVPQTMHTQMRNYEEKKTQITGKKSGDPFLERMEQLHGLKTGATKLQRKVKTLNLKRFQYRKGSKRNLVKNPVENKILMRIAIPPTSISDETIYTDEVLRYSPSFVHAGNPIKSSILKDNYISAEKIKTIKAYFNQIIEETSAKVSEETGPSWNYKRESYPSGKILKDKWGKPIKEFLQTDIEERGKMTYHTRKKGEFVDSKGITKQSVKDPANAENVVSTPFAKGTSQTTFSLKPTGDKWTPWEKLEQFFKEAFSQAKETGQYTVETSKLKQRQGKPQFDTNIIISEQAFKDIFRNEVIPMLFAKADDSDSKFNFGSADPSTPRKNLESLQADKVISKEGLLLDAKNPLSYDFRFGEARGSDDISFNETIGLGKEAWGDASKDIKGEGYSLGTYKTGQDISEGALSRGIGVPPGYIGRGGPEYTTTRNLDKQLLLPVMEEVSVSETMKLDRFDESDINIKNQKQYVKLLDQVLEEADKIQKVQAGSATGWDNEIDISKVHQHTVDDFVGKDENQTVQEEMEQIRQQYNNIVKEYDIGSKAWQQETAKLLQRHQGAQVAQLREIDPILAHLVLRGAHTQKGINAPIYDDATADKYTLRAGKLRRKGDPAYETDPKEDIPFHSVQKSKEISQRRTKGTDSERKQLRGMEIKPKETSLVDIEEVKAAEQKLNLQSEGGWKKLEYFASKGILSEFVTGPEPVENITTQVKQILKASKHQALLRSGDQVVAPSEPIVAPQSESFVLTDKVKPKQLTLNLEPGEVPDVKIKPGNINPYPNAAHDPTIGLQDQLEGGTRSEPTKSTRLYQGQTSLEGSPIEQGGISKVQQNLEYNETIDMKKSKLTGDWMTRQEQLRTGEQALHGKINPKLGIFSFGMGLMTGPLSAGVAYKNVQRLNEQEALYGLGTDGATGPEPSWGNLGAPVTEEDFKQEFWSRMTMGIIPSVQQLRWQRQMDPGAGISPNA